MTVCTLASSSSGNCTLVSHGGTHILIDAGLSLRRIREGLRRFDLSPDDLACVLVTHEHSDHISGIKMLVKYHKTSLFSSLGAVYALCAILPEAEPYMNSFDTGTELEFGDIAITSFRTPHDANESVGYILRAGGKKLVYATDLGYVTSTVLDAAQHSDIAIIEANHDRQMLLSGAYPDYLKKRILSRLGHLENSDSGYLASQLAMTGARYILLAHLSRENNTPELALKTVGQTLTESGIMLGKDVQLDAAPPFSGSFVYDL